MIETLRLKSTVSMVTFRDRELGMSYVSISGMIETLCLKSTVSTVTGSSDRDAFGGVSNLKYLTTYSYDRQQICVVVIND